MLLLVFGHIDADHGVLVVEEKIGEGAGACGAQENKRTDGALGVVESGAGAADGVGYAF